MNDFGYLKTISKTFYVFGSILITIAVMAIIACFNANGTENLMIAAGVLIGTFTLTLVCFAMAGLINLFLQIERNTRNTKAKGE